MKREELTALGYTDEQVTQLLDLMHKTNNNITKENEKLKADLDTANNKIVGLTQIEQEYNTLKQSQLTEQEKQSLKEKEIEERLSNARKIDNKAMAKEIFSEIGGVSEDVLNSVVTDDTEQTKKNATAVLNQINSVKEATVNQTKQEMSELDIKPTASNNLETKVEMTWKKFDSMTSDEQEKFVEEHPEEFAKL